MEALAMDVMLMDADADCEGLLDSDAECDAELEDEDVILGADDSDWVALALALADGDRDVEDDNDDVAVVLALADGDGDNEDDMEGVELICVPQSSPVHPSTHEHVPLPECLET